MKKFFISLLEIFEIAFVTVGTVFLIRTFLVQPFLVSGSSMVPNFQNGDYLLIDELVYHFREPKRGEVAVFHYPNDETTYFIKRIIGLPGEKVSVSGGKVVVFNSEHPQGFALSETYLPPETVTNRNTEITLAEGEYFVLGDNRSFSFDSRDWGVLKKTEIVGMARVRLWPPGALRAFAAPNY
jgi:signal peptidase I